VIATHQATAAAQALPVTTRMLAEQGVDEAAEALLNSPAFTTELDAMTRMLEEVADAAAFARLVESLVQDAGRAAEQVAATVHPNVGYVRLLTPPSCSRCAVLAGRVYRYSTGFLRHPNCDCVMVPTSQANPADVLDPVEAMRRGQVTGLSKADRKAIEDGADFNQVVNVRLRKAGLRQAGRVLSRSGRPTPEAIYRVATSRRDAIERLIAAGYLRA